MKTLMSSYLEIIKYFFETQKPTAFEISKVKCVLLVKG